MEKDSFVFRKGWKDAISGLPDEVRLEIYEAIIEYGTSGKLSDLKPMAMLAFNFAKGEIDRDAEKSEAISRKRQEAVSRRWGKYKCIQTDTNYTNVLQEKEKTEEKEKSPAPPYKEKKDKKERDDIIAPTVPVVATPPITRRREKFYQSLVPYVQKYGREMVRDFYDYWTEPNKSNSKMRFELERTWDLSRRLSTWERRDSKFTSRHETDRTNNQGAGQRMGEAASIVARILAEDDGEIRK